MNPLSRHYHQLVGLNQDWVIADVQLDVAEKTMLNLVPFACARRKIAKPHLTSCFVG